MSINKRFTFVFGERITTKNRARTNAITSVGPSSVYTRAAVRFVDVAVSKPSITPLTFTDTDGGRRK